MVGEAGNRRAQPCSVLHVFAIVGIVLGVGSSGAAAQQADPFKGVEEMVVTGYEAPIDLGEDSSATIGFDAEDLSAFQIENVSDLGAYIPNVEIRS
ncbi:MAG: hypothetical protein VCB25_01790, partial [Myxococcota bacterium]